MKNNKKKFWIIIVSVLVVTITLLVIYLISKDKVKDDTDANMNFIINDTLKEGNNSKAKVFLLAGQSNASGCSYNIELESKVQQEKYDEYKTGYSNIYINYFNDNGNNKSSGFINVKIGQGANDSFFGPELGMAEKLNELFPNETISIIKYAWGGSNLHTQWNSNGGNLYKAFIKFTKQSMEYLENKNYDAQIVSMMWMQGESDATKTHSHNYQKNLFNMINSIRDELKDYIISSGMSFIDAYISNSPYWEYYIEINNAKKNICSYNSLNICIDTIYEGLTYNNEPINNPDLAHYDSLSEIKLGHLFIEKFLKMHSF